MTQNEIIEMAREAGGEFYVTSGNQTPTWYFPHSTIFDFVKLVAAKEREANIKIIKETPFSNWFQADVIEAIRARGEQA
jgi:hypothetical protein